MRRAFPRCSTPGQAHPLVSRWGATDPGAKQTEILERLPRKPQFDVTTIAPADMKGFLLNPSP